MSKPLSKRPKKRTIVRWDENLNELTLLTVQSVCNSQSIKIPWADVAKTMGHNVTEGAIVQHLAKVRARRVQEGKDVPPPLKRGSTSGVSKSSSPPGSKYQRGSRDAGAAGTMIDEDSGEEWTGYRASKRRKTRPRSKPAQSLRPQIWEEENTASDSGDELLAPGARFLQLPHDRQRSPTPQPQSKIVIFKCPKAMLETLDRAAPLKAPSLDIASANSVAEMPALKPQVNSDDGHYGSIKSEVISNSIPMSSIPTNNFQFLQSAVMQETPRAPANSQLSAEEMQDFKYSPTGDPSIDLPTLVYKGLPNGQDILPNLFSPDQNSFENFHDFQTAPNFDQFYYLDQTNQGVEGNMFHEQNLSFSDQGAGIWSDII
ncbi:hypothetical protein BJY04DRAFT_194466 [Aspergillus karnatakaensis]|uniref:uncharacterized protein n=1 Tax=Aspergillus karnatakaensis TaxID=1810916 RepID=UPI003CCCDDF0